MSREVKCPRCGKKTIFSPENPYRPFCSDRCKLIDLGEWAAGRYAIPVEDKTGADNLDSDEDKPQQELSPEDEN